MSAGTQKDTHKGRISPFVYAGEMFAVSVGTQKDTCVIVWGQLLSVPMGTQKDTRKTVWWQLRSVSVGTQKDTHKTV